ncbi:MAG: hypothetical protein HQL89_14510 [Magnetococcales bacterium]|nr:hypothetical protein [Magnetococcales bacterium]
MNTLESGKDSLMAVIWQTLLVMTLGGFMRLIAWFGFGKDHLVLTAPTGVSWDRYVTSIQHHFWESLYFFHLKPPGIFIKDSIVISIFGTDGFVAGSLILISVAGCVAGGVFYRFLLRLGIAAVPGLVIALSWSAALIIWEYWRNGMFWDHWNILFMTLFLAALQSRYLTPSVRSSLLTGLAGGLLILVWPIMPAIVPVMILLTVRWDKSGPLRNLVVSLMIPLVVLLPIMVKNFLQFNIFTTSSLGGAVIGQTMGIAFDYDLDAIKNMAEHNNYPEWWIWCLDEGRTRVGLEKSIMPLYARCVQAPEHDPQRLHDFDALEKKLDQLGETRLLAVVKEDKKREEHQPWLFHNLVELPSHIAIEFGKITSRLFGDTLREHPGTLVHALAHSSAVFLIKGPLWLTGHWYERQQRPLPVILVWLGWLFVPILYLGIVAAVFFFTGYLSSLLWSKPWHRFFPNREKEYILFVGSVAFLLGTVAVNGLICCENDRMFMSFVPVVLPMAVLMAAKFTEPFFPGIFDRR